MTSSNKALLALAILPNMAWIGFLAGLGAWRTVRGEPAMTDGEGPILVGIGVFLALACPTAANYFRPRQIRQAV